MQARPLTLTPRPSGGVRGPLWPLVLLFAFYGPSFSVVGELRYVEIAIIALLAINFNRAFSMSGQWERRLMGLFLLAALAQVASDFINDAEITGTLKRSSTYIIIFVLIAALQWLGRRDPSRIYAILVGYSLSWILILFIGSDAIPLYEFEPWRLGLGYAATVFLCVMIAAIPALTRFGAAALLAMAIVHVALGSRAMAIMAAITALATFISNASAHSAPSPFRVGVLIRGSILGLPLLAAGYYAMIFTVDAHILPEEVEARMDTQLNSRYGLIVASRPGIVAAMYAISRRPLTGYGSTGSDPYVTDYYDELAAAGFGEESYYQILKDKQLEGESAALPSHSHLLGAWVEGGVLASLVWFAVLSLAIYVLSRVVLWRRNEAPLFIFISLTTVWDILFSPGPHRMDMAIRILVLCYAEFQLRVYDARNVSAPAGNRGAPVYPPPAQPPIR